MLDIAPETERSRHIMRLKNRIRSGKAKNLTVNLRFLQQQMNGQLKSKDTAELVKELVNLNLLHHEQDGTFAVVELEKET